MCCAAPFCAFTLAWRSNCPKNDGWRGLQDREKASLFSASICGLLQILQEV
jgi:hypothetical protein